MNRTMPPKIKVKYSTPTTTTTTPKKVTIPKITTEKRTYLVEEKLGNGTEAEVRLGLDEKTGEFFALRFTKKKYARTNPKKELDIFNATRDLPNIIHLKDYCANVNYNNQNRILWVLEYASNGDFFSYVASEPFEESLARTYFHQLIEGLDGLHQRGFCHLDIKPENLLLDANFQLKITDFGSSKKIGSEKGRTGTLKYMAPEIMESRRYDGRIADVWSCGVFLFIMMASNFPYLKLDKHDINARYFFPPADYTKFWKTHEEKNAKFNASDDVKKLINEMLSINVSSRISIDEIKCHRWYKNEIIKKKELIEIMRNHPKSN